MIGEELLLSSEELCKIQIIEFFFIEYSYICDIVKGEEIIGSKG